MSLQTLTSPKIAFIQANIGGMDGTGKPPEQTVAYDYFYFTEKNLPRPLPNLSNRMRGRYLKTQMHSYLPGYDIYIWADASMEIKSTTFIAGIVKDLADNDVVMTLHPQRKNVYEEIGLIVKEIQNGNEYLCARYQSEPFGAELEFYGREGMPHTYPLYATGLFAFNSFATPAAAFNEWWLRTIEFTNFDQCFFSYIAWKWNLRVKGITMYPFVERHKHLAVK